MFGLFEGGNTIGGAYKGGNAGGAEIGFEIFAGLFFLAAFSYIIWWIFIKDEEDKNKEAQDIMQYMEERSV